MTPAAGSPTRICASRSSASGDPRVLRSTRHPDVSDGDGARALLEPPRPAAVPWPGRGVRGGAGGDRELARELGVRLSSHPGQYTSSTPMTRSARGRRRARGPGRALRRDGPRPRGRRHPPRGGAAGGRTPRSTASRRALSALRARGAQARDRERRPHLRARRRPALRSGPGAASSGTSITTTATTPTGSATARRSTSRSPPGPRRHRRRSTSPRRKTAMEERKKKVGRRVERAWCSPSFARTPT